MMYTCDHCREWIWDDLFGLLEAKDSADLHRHVTACGACQAEMVTAVAQLRLVTEAARLDEEIPLFTAPAVDGAQPFIRSSPREALATKGRLPILPWLATAAAVLLLIGLPFGFYEYGRVRCEAAWHAAEDSVAQIVKQRQESQARAQLDRENLVQIASAKHLRLQVIGPAAYQLGAVQTYRLWVTDVEGRPADASVTALLLDAGKAVALETKKLAGKGEWLLDFPANLPLTADSTPRLEVALRDQENLAPVQTHLHVLEPAYQTHLATDKPVYQVGDTIFFRSLTLERFGLKVPNREFTAVYTLADAHGAKFQTVGGLTQKNGIGGGEFEWSPSWPAGEYTLTVAEAAKHFPPVTRRLWVRPAASGPRGQAETVTRTMPVEPKRLEVEFFPEGGDLVADLDNRVYFRVRTPMGQSADLEGAIIDGHDREVATLHTARAEGHRGLGMFTLRPRVGETYQLRSRQQGMEVRAALPPVQATGVALSLQAAVVRPDEPIQTILRRTGPERPLVIGLFCQGRLVAQELVSAKTEKSEVRLAPTVPCSGVLRVTVFEERQGQLWPLAERLAYRRPEGRLALSVKADKEIYTPGEKVRLTIQSREENGKPQPAWFLVSVVDQGALSRNRAEAGTSLPAYFLLTSELQQPEGLEQADILLSASAEAARALDLFLATQGWRRFTDQEPKGLVLENASAPRRAGDLAVPAIMKLDNLDQVQPRYFADLNQAFADLNVAAAERDQVLVTEGKERLRAAGIAAQELDDVSRAGEVIRLSIGLGGLVLFATSCLFLAIGLLRLARGLTATRRYLAGAFAALLLCAVIVWGPASGGGPAGDPTKFSRIADGYVRKFEKQIDPPAIAFQNNQQLPPSRALSQGRWPLPPRALEKHLAGFGSDGEVGNADQGQKPGPVLPGKFIGSIVGRGAPSPAPLPPNRNARNAPVPLRIRTYAYSQPIEPASGREAPDTILWQPVLFAEGGTSDVNFELPLKATTYRIRVQGHNEDGRLGAVQEKLECRQNITETAK